jgi:hypothetical protein
VNVALVAVVARVPATAAPPAGVSVTETDEVDSAPAKVTPTVVATATPVAFAAGLVDATVTGVSVVNAEVNGAMAVPPGLDALTVTVYELLADKAADGVNVADEEVTARVPGTDVPPGPVSVTDTDEVFSWPVNVTVTGLVSATPVAPAAGVTDTTEGAVSTGAPAVNTTSTK